MTWTVETYHRARARLIREMGGACVLCGATADLEFGHTGPRTWTAREVNRMTRIKLYRRDWVAGILQLECRGCNRGKLFAGRPRRNGNAKKFATGDDFA